MILVLVKIYNSKAGNNIIGGIVKNRHSWLTCRCHFPLKILAMLRFLLKKALGVSPVIDLKSFIIWV